jgi:DNA repair exonuclease SbcCD ATPase subunit
MSAPEIIEPQIKAELEKLKNLIKEIEQLHVQLKTRVTMKTENPANEDLREVIKRQIDVFYEEKGLKTFQPSNVDIDKLKSIEVEIGLLRKELNSKWSATSDLQQKLEKQEKKLSTTQSETRIMGNLTILILAALLFIFIYVISRLN